MTGTKEEKKRRFESLRKVWRRETEILSRRLRQASLERESEYLKEVTLLVTMSSKRKASKQREEPEQRC